MKINVHNDDFGLTWGFTEATYRLCKRNIVNSLSIRTNGTDFERAKKISHSLAKLGVHLGIHLNLTDGPTCQDNLANQQGKYKYSFLQYLLLLLLPNKKLERIILKEFELQYHKLKGLKITQVDSHDHVHQIPRLFKLVCLFCQKHHLKHIRLIREPLLIVHGEKINPISFVKFCLINFISVFNQKTAQRYGLKTSDVFYGVLYTNHMNQSVVNTSLKQAIQNNCPHVEILLHPAIIDNSHDFVYTSAFIKKYANLINRQIEFKALFNNSRLKSQLESLRARSHNQI